MPEQIYKVEVQSDFLTKITRAHPVHALSEFIWNALDADATRVDVSFQKNALGALSKITVRDDGTGMEFEKAPELFSRSLKNRPCSAENWFLFRFPVQWSVFRPVCRQPACPPAAFSRPLEGSFRTLQAVAAIRFLILTRL